MSACVPTRAADPTRPRRIHQPHSPPPTPPRRFRIAGADLSASITVFLIAVPLSLGIALATGAPLQAGLVAAAVGGIVAGLLGGAPLQVSGPAAGLIVVTADLIQRYGWRATCAITVLAGLAQLGLGCLRVARSGARRQPRHRARHARRDRRDHRRRPAAHRARRHPAELRRSTTSRALPAPVGARCTPPRWRSSALTVAVLVGWPRLPGTGGARAAHGPGRARRRRRGHRDRRARRADRCRRVDLPSWSSHALRRAARGAGARPRSPPSSPSRWSRSMESLLVARSPSTSCVPRSPRRRPGPAPLRLDRELLGQGAANVRLRAARRAAGRRRRRCAARRMCKPGP